MHTFFIATRGRDQGRPLDSLRGSVLTGLFIFGSFSHVPRNDLAGVLGNVNLIDMSIELTLQGLLVFLASGAMAGGLNVEPDCNARSAFGCYRNISHPFRNPQRWFLHVFQFPKAASPRVSVGFHSPSAPQTLPNQRWWRHNRIYVTSINPVGS